MTEPSSSRIGNGKDTTKAEHDCYDTLRDAEWVSENSQRDVVTNDVQRGARTTESRKTE